MIAIAAAAVGACRGSGDAARLAALAEGCTLNSDCAAQFVCAFRTCHVQCESSRDCEPGRRCVEGARPVHVCQLPDEETCTLDSQCRGAEVCGPDGRCRDACDTDK